MKTHRQTEVVFQDSFWTRLRQVARKESIPYQWKALNDELPTASSSHCMQNFRIAGGRAQGDFYGCVFQDSDAAKWLESVAYALSWQKDDELEALADQAIDDIVSAQRDDGYLNTYYTLTGLDKRFTNLMDHHELYCAGHMLEAAVAYAQVTGKRKLLDAMIRYVDCIDRHIGAEEGKIHGYPGHPELELALMRLYDLTGDPKHLRLARYFVDERGKSPLFFEEESKRMNRRSKWLESPLGYQYYQAGKPVREQTDAEGHAVRALYLYSGMADVARETDDTRLTEACHALWNSVVKRRMYVTGGVGSSEYGESFTVDYDLPNDTCYTETCASIALIFFARRMFAMDPRSEYADVMERALYNGVISGMQLDGKRFFYTNPLEVLPEVCLKSQTRAHIRPERQEWFDCACCPPNLIRLLMSLQDYVLSVVDRTIYVQLYAQSDWRTEVEGSEVCFACRTEYPWDGRISLTCQAAGDAPFTLALRIPGWCRQWTLSVNGQMLSQDAENGYVRLERVWKHGDTVTLALDMPVEKVLAHPRVKADAGKLAVMRGPIVYTLEERDNGANLHQLLLPRDAVFAITHHPELEGMTALTCDGYREVYPQWQEDELYQTQMTVDLQPVNLTWIPYFAWGNRGIGEMQVWIRQ